MSISQVLGASNGLLPGKLIDGSTGISMAGGTLSGAVIISSGQADPTGLTLTNSVGSVNITTGTNGNVVVDPAGTGVVLIGGGNALPAGVANLIGVSGGVAPRTAGAGAGTFALAKNTVGAVDVVAYLPITVGATNYWLPLMPSDPQTT